MDPLGTFFPGGWPTGNGEIDDQATKRNTGSSVVEQTSIFLRPGPERLGGIPRESHISMEFFAVVETLSLLNFVLNYGPRLPLGT